MQDKGLFKEAYKIGGLLFITVITILLSEDSDFVFLSEDDRDILIAEQPETSVGLLKDSYNANGELVESAPLPDGLLKDSYKQKGTYEREEL